MHGTIQILIVMSHILVTISLIGLSNNVKSLIYSYQYKYCGGQFCSSDPAYEPPGCSKTKDINLYENTSTSNSEITNQSRRCEPCSQCSCHDSCQYFGNCCVDKYIGGTYFISCQQVEMYKNGETKTHIFMVVTKCLHDAPNYNPELAWKCEHGELGHIQDGRPVTAPHPNNISITFRNKYCALCYDVRSYTSWDVYIACEEDFDTDNYSDINVLLRSVKFNDDCVVSFDLSQGQLPQTCFPSANMISTCNETGNWREYNKSIKAACESYLNPTRNWKYRNMFCYLCNGGNHYELECPSNCMLVLTKPVVLRSFAALLNFENSDAEIIKTENEQMNHRIKRIGKQKSDQCRKEDRYDIQSEICREVYCPLAGSDINSTCIELVPSPLYVLTLWNATAYYSEEVITPFFGIMSSICLDVINKLRKVVEDIGFLFSDARAIEFASIYSTDHLSIKECHLELKLNLLQNFSLALSREQLQENQTLNISSPDKEMLVTVVNKYKTIMDKLAMPEIFMKQSSTELIKMDRNQIIEVPLAFNVSCPMVRYASNDVKALNDTLIIHGHNILKDNEYFMINNGEYFVCLEASSRENQPDMEPTPISQSSGPLTESITTAVCLSCSLLFLLFTMLVYTILPELHTVPGLNLIFLTASLFVAQILYLFAAGTVATPTICTVLGVLIHYFWLAAFAWMVVCCLHMFRVFTDTFSSLNLADDMRCLMLKYSLSAFGVAAVIVLTTIVTTYVLSGYTTIAYGGATLCFVSTGIVSVISFGIPVGLVVVVNAVLFGVTTLYIRRAGNVNTHLGIRHQTNDISKFFKLSTLTGLSWMFGFLGYFFQRVELIYTFIVLSAGQGVFIFVSFVVSRRVLSLVKAKLRCHHRMDRNISSSGRPTHCSNGYTSTATLESTTRL